MGRGTFELSGDDRGITLRTPSDETITAGDPESLLVQYLGFDLPVAGLPYWMRGLPAPRSRPSAMEHDQYGRLSHLEQGPWRLHFSRYTELEQYELPGRISIVADGIELRLVAQRWMTSF